MKNFQLSSLLVAIVAVSSTSIAIGETTPATSSTNIFTGSTTATGSTSTASGETTATSNGVTVPGGGVGPNSPNGNPTNITTGAKIPLTDAQKAEQLATAAAENANKSATTQAAVECAQNGLGAEIIKTVADRTKEVYAAPTVSEMVQAAKENKNSLSVGCFTASTEIINLSALVPDIRNGLGSVIGQVVQKQINSIIQKTKDTLMQQVCDVGNEMLTKAMKPLNDKISSVNGQIDGLTLDSLVGSEIAKSVGGDDKFSQMVRQSLGEVVSQTDAELAKRRKDYSDKIGFGDGSNYDPLAGVKAVANSMVVDADATMTAAGNAASNTTAGSMGQTQATNPIVNSTTVKSNTPAPTAGNSSWMPQTTTPVQTQPVQQPSKAFTPPATTTTTPTTNGSSGNAFSNLK